MSRSPIALTAFALFVCASPVVATADTQAPVAKATPHAHRSPGFSNKVHSPGGSGRVSGSDCNRRSIGVDNSRNQMGPGSSSKSQTLIAVPIGGGSVNSATRQAQINEACGHAH